MGVVRIMISRIIMIGACNIGNEFFLSVAAQHPSSVSLRHLKYCKGFAEGKM